MDFNEGTQAYEDNNHQSAEDKIPIFLIIWSIIHLKRRRASVINQKLFHSHYVQNKNKGLFSKSATG